MLAAYYRRFVATLSAGFNVLDKDANSFAVAVAVLDKDANSFDVAVAVLDKDGNAFTVI